MTELRKSLEMATKDAIDFTNETMTDFGLAFEDCFPYSSTKLVTINGKQYRIKLEINPI
jgi:hypothetical protein